MPEPRLLVSGAGIAGLAAALACGRAGRAVRVIERAGAFGEVGAGIQIGPNGTREGLPPEEFNAAAQSTLAQLQWEEAKAQAGPEAGRPEEMTQWLRETREWLSREYEGWDNEAGIPGAPTLDESIEQLVRAAEDDDLVEASPGAVEGLRAYLSARERAQDLVDEARENGVVESQSFTSSAETAEVRDWLRSTAEWIIGRHPEFQTMWERVFSRELKDVAEEDQ